MAQVRSIGLLLTVPSLEATSVWQVRVCVRSELSWQESTYTVYEAQAQRWPCNPPLRLPLHALARRQNAVQPNATSGSSEP